MTRHIIFRELGLAVSHASCESPAALDSAIEHASRALQALRELRAAAKPRESEGRSGTVEHISKPLARALDGLRRSQGRG